MPFHLADCGAVTAATDLMTRFGGAASGRAAARARAARDIGNYVHFCHWRQVERLILLLDSDEAVGTVH